jgi:cell division control protein 6
MPFPDESRIFKNEDILSFEYLPDILPQREMQIKQLADNLLPASKGRIPQNTFIHGSPGIGKTAVVKYVFREFENYSGINTVYLNCWNFNTSISILSEITVSLGMPVVRRGIGKDEILSRLREVIEKSKKGLIICLDEVDQLVRKDQSVLYDLSRMNQYVKNPIGIVLISNNPFLFSDVEPRIKSSLAVEEIEFKPYSIEEMKNVLQERAKNAFFSVESGVIILASNHAIKKGSDVRAGIECLLKAGRVAEQENDIKVKVEHIKKILKEVLKIKPQVTKENLTEIEKIILSIIEENNELSFGDLYNKYCEKAENPITEKPFLNYVRHLDELNLLVFKKRKVNGKRFIIKFK